MATAVRFSTNASTVLDGSGNGSVRLAPAGEKWQITRTRVECRDTTNQATAKMYERYIGESFVIDGTRSGSSGDTSDISCYLEDGEAMFIEWTGGTPGTTAIATVSGWKSAPEGGFRAVH